METILILMLSMMITLPGVLASVTKIYPTDDAFVRDKYPNKNYGTGDQKEDLRAGYNINYGTDRSYLKFHLSLLEGKNISSAIFSIQNIFYQNDNPIINLYLTGNNWNENTITWNNAPGFSNLIDSQVVNSPGRIRFNVSSVIEEGEISFVMIEKNEDTDVHFASKDFNKGIDGAEINWPYIEVEYEGGSCNTEADTDCDGCVGLVEMVGLMSKYKSGQTNINLLEMVNLMSRYKGGEISC